MAQFMPDKGYMVRGLSWILDHFADELLAMIFKTKTRYATAPTEWFSPSLWPLVSRALYGIADDDLDQAHSHAILATTARRKYQRSNFNDVSLEDVHFNYDRNPFLVTYLNGEILF